MKCKNWERRNRGPQLLVMADRALAQGEVEDAMVYLRERTHLPVTWMAIDGVKCSAMIIDPRSRPC